MLKISSIPKIENSSKEQLIKSQQIKHHRQIIDSDINKKLVNNKISISSNYNPYIITNKQNTNTIFSVKSPITYKGKMDIYKINSTSPFQQNAKINLFSSKNITNSYSDLGTSASFSSQKSSESFYSNNPNNISQFTPNNIFIGPYYINGYNYQCKNEFPLNLNIELNNNYYNNNYSSKGFINIISHNSINNQKNNPFLNSLNLKYNDSLKKQYFNYNCNNILNNNNKIKNESNYSHQKSNNLPQQKNLINKNQIIIEPFNRSNSIDIDLLKSNNSININNENNNHKKPKNYYNKYDSSRENNINENTVILSLKLKVGKNDIRQFDLKKFDDLFVTFQRFMTVNQIKQDLEKPLISIIFKTLNKIFYAFNNKIGLYDLQYLNTLERLWIKNNRIIPKTRNKNHSDKSTTSSSESSSKSSHKEIKSNSYQNTDGNSSDEKRSQHTAKSF